MIDILLFLLQVIGAVIAICFTFSLWLFLYLAVAYTVVDVFRSFRRSHENKKFFNLIEECRNDFN